MRVSRIVTWALSAGMATSGTNLVFGQAPSTGAPAYPGKTVRMVTAEPGGSSDIQARVTAQGIAGPLGQQVIVDNRPAGIIAIETVAKAPPDGYTILYYGSVTWIEPLLRPGAPWDPIKDFAPLTLASTSPNVLVVHPSLPVKTVKELIALAKARPGDLNYASTSNGSTNHLAAELFKFMANVNIVRISYKGTPGALTGIMGGQVQLMFPSAGGAMPLVKAGRLKALAVTTAEPSALTPGMPTAAASGLPGYESVSLYGVFVPAKTPAAIISRLNQEIVRVLNQADVKEKFLNISVEVVGSSPAQLAATVKAEMDRMEKVIKAAGIRAE